MVEDVFYLERRLPEQVFREQFHHYLFEEFDWAMGDEFWNVIQALAKKTKDDFVLTAVLDPDSVEYFYKSFHYYNWMKLPVGLSPDEYFAVLEWGPEESLTDAVLYNSFTVVWLPPSMKWAIWGERSYTAMLLGGAKIFSEMADLITGELRFLFQHAEEKFPGGARDMVRAGVMEGVDVVVGAHLWTPLAVGKVGVAYGPMMAAPDLFRLTIQGKGGHAASPNQTVDAIAVGAQVVTNLQHLVSRRTDPLDSLVVSITEFHAGTEHNIIPDKAEMRTVPNTNYDFNEAIIR